MSSTDRRGLQAFPDELTDREAWLEPFEWYGEMRADAPVRYDRSRRSWDVFRYDDVKSVLSDDETFSTDNALANDAEEPERPAQRLLLDTMLLEDPPRHDELRNVVDDAFQPRAIRELEPRIREVTRNLLDDALAGDSTMEVVTDVAYPLPVIVIAELLGVPADERDQFKSWSDTLVTTASAADHPENVAKRQREARREMATYFVELLDDRRENPRDDLLSRIVAAERDESIRFSRQEALGTCVLLLLAGNVTTTNLVTNAVRCFAAHDLFDEFGDDRRATGTAIEEVLRYRTPVQAMTRVATRDATLRGESIGEGERVIVWIGSANRDERAFDGAGSFVPDRSPNNHLGFGHGTHYCLGAPLARLEATVALTELCARLEGVELADATLSPVRSSFIYGVESLPIRYERATDSAYRE